MANSSSLLTTILLVVVVSGVAAAAGLYLYRKGRAEPRAPRLAFVERTSLDGGRHLLLVRRDDVEHLILVGGPIDLVVETGIKAAPVDVPIPSAVSGLVDEQAREELGSEPPMQQAGPPRHASAPSMEDDTLELTPLLEAKAAQ